MCEIPLEAGNDLQCPICLELFKHPIILPCSHILCRSPCAENLFEFNCIRCPVCRDNCYVSGGIGSLPRVIALESIIEKYRAERRKDGSKLQKQPKRPQNGNDPNGMDGSVSCGNPLGMLQSCRLNNLSETTLLSQSPNRDVPLLQRTANTTPTLTASLPTPISVALLNSCLESSLQDIKLCTHHGIMTSVYCLVCRKCVCEICQDPAHHVTHATKSLDNAAQQVKVKPA